jgi:hypothetical protein
MGGRGGRYSTAIEPAALERNFEVLNDGENFSGMFRRNTTRRSICIVKKRWIQASREYTANLAKKAQSFGLVCFGHGEEAVPGQRHTTKEDTCELDNRLIDCESFQNHSKVCAGKHDDRFRFANIFSNNVSEFVEKRIASLALSPTYIVVLDVVKIMSIYVRKRTCLTC